MKLNIGDNVVVTLQHSKKLVGTIIEELDGDKYKVDIPNYRGKNEIHISKLKLKKKSYNYLSADNFPLFENERGLLPDIISKFFKIEFNIKDNNCGLYRLGINQDNESFLKCIKRENENLDVFKRNICQDIDNIEDFSNLTNLIQLFRNEESKCKIEEDNQNNFEKFKKRSIKNFKENIKKYILSNEYKDSFILTSLIKEITKNKSKSFDYINLNIITFDILENKIVIRKNINRFDINNKDSFILIFKLKSQYEPIYIKNDKELITKFITEEKKEFEIKTKNKVYIGENKINGIIEKLNLKKLQ